MSRYVTDEDHVQKYVEQLSRYYDPKRLQVALDRPERALARVIDRQAHEIERLQARVSELEHQAEVLTEARRRLGEEDQQG